MLRQLLGASQASQADGSGVEVAITAESPTAPLSPADAGVLAVTLPGYMGEGLSLALGFADGSEKTLNLRRKSHVPAALRSETWAVSLLGYETRGAGSVRLIPEQGATLAAPRLRHMAARR